MRTGRTVCTNCVHDEYVKLSCRRLRIVSTISERQRKKKTTTTFEMKFYSFMPSECLCVGIVLINWIFHTRIWCSSIVNASFASFIFVPVWRWNQKCVHSFNLGQKHEKLKLDLNSMLCGEALCSILRKRCSELFRCHADERIERAMHFFFVAINGIQRNIRYGIPKCEYISLAKQQNCMWSVLLAAEKINQINQMSIATHKTAINIAFRCSIYLLSIWTNFIFQFALNPSN